MTLNVGVDNSRVHDRRVVRVVGLVVAAAVLLPRAMQDVAVAGWSQ